MQIVVKCDTFRIAQKLYFRTFKDRRYNVIYSDNKRFMLVCDNLTIWFVEGSKYRQFIKCMRNYKTLTSLQWEEVLGSGRKKKTGGRTK